MILIVDSGATKADWTALNSKGEKNIFYSNFRVKS